MAELRAVNSPVEGSIPSSPLKVVMAINSKKHTDPSMHLPEGMRCRDCVHLRDGAKC